MGRYLYPKPKERYDRFRLNPYSPLYHGLAALAAANPNTYLLPNLYGPYANPGSTLSYYEYYPFVQYFSPDIGRACFAYSRTETYYFPQWQLNLPQSEIITLVALCITDGGAVYKNFLSLLDSTAICAGLGEYSDGDYPGYNWKNTGGSTGWARSEGKFWPINSWFLYSATFYPGGVYAYLSNRGQIGVGLLSGVWPNVIANSYILGIAGIGNTSIGNGVADGMVFLRFLTRGELDALADLGNVDLRVANGPPLILPVRTYWPSASAVAAFNPAWEQRTNSYIGVDYV